MKLKNEDRKLREISLANAELIGDGFYSKVYRIDEETIVKQYVRNPKVEDVYRELSLAKQAFIKGIPTAISYDVVMADGKYGVVFEMINGGSLKDALLCNYGKNPEKTKEIMEEHGRLLKTINETVVSDSQVPSAKGIFLDRMEKGRTYFNPKTFEKLKNLIEALPENKTYVHGDCHLKNIMQNSKGEFMLIDMDTLSYGNPIFEMCGINACYNGFEMYDPGNNEKFLGVKRGIINELYEIILKIYFENKNPDEMKSIQAKIELLTMAHMALWFSENIPDSTEMIKKYSNHLDEIIDNVSELAI